MTTGTPALEVPFSVILHPNVRMRRVDHSNTDPEILAYPVKRLAMLRGREELTLEEAGEAAGLNPATVPTGWAG